MARRKSVEALEAGLASLSKLQIRHEERIRRIKVKIAVQEELIADAKLEEKEKAEA